MNKIIALKAKLLLLLFLLCAASIFAQENVNTDTDTLSIYPANPEESTEARQLLKFLYSISGKKTLTGIHNYLGKMSESTDKVYEITGKYPAIWGGDFGFADSTHDIDNIKYRPLLVDEIKKQYARGAIIVMSYHQANPAIGEPCKFEGGVQSKLTNEQWKELTTPGTPLYLAWKKQMDTLANYLLQLKDAHIPVLFRPYHEMNGNWFWWGNHPGDSGYVALWKQLFNYYTMDKKLDNLIWVWTTDRPWEGVEQYFPGDYYVDALGSDIYPLENSKVVFRQEWYDRMKKLANGKPLGLSENSIIPDENILHSQPWAWFMEWTTWGLDSNPADTVKKVFDSDYVYTLENIPGWRGSNNSQHTNTIESSGSKQP